MIALEMDGIFSDNLNDTVIYNDGTSSSSIDAVIDYFGGGQNDASDNASILVKKSDVPSPDYRHTFTISGAVWYVRPSGKGKHFILSEDDNSYLLVISKNERFSQWRT